MSGEAEALEIARNVLREVAKCRVVNLVKATQTLIFAVSSLVLAFTLSTPSYEFLLTTRFLATSLALALLALYELFRYTASKSFVYMNAMANTFNLKYIEKAFRESLIAMLIASIFTDAFLLKSMGVISIVIPFIVFSIVRLVLSKDENQRIGSLVTLALSMLASAQKSSAIALTLVLSLTLSGILEALLHIEEAERCATEREPGRREGTAAEAG